MDRLQENGGEKARWLAELIEATERKAVAEERVQAILSDLLGRIERVCETNDEVGRLLRELEVVLGHVDAKITMLVEFFAAYVGEDADRLKALQSRVENGALKPHSITVQATGEVTGGRDVVVGGGEVER